MKIAFVGFENVENPLLWAGIPNAIFKELKKDLHLNVKALHAENVKINYPIKVLLKRLIFNKILRHKYGVYRFDRENWYIKQKSKIINVNLNIFQPNIIFCCTPFQIIELNYEAPIFIYTDATFLLLRKFYPDYKRYAIESFKNGNKAEMLALNKASHIFYSSKWAKKSAIKDYYIDEDKITIIPFGSNLELPNDFKIDLNKRINIKKLNLLFVGFDYERKGLSKAIKIHETLILKGVNSILTIIGPSNLPYDFKKLKSIKFLGKLSKTINEEKKLILEAYKQTHFFILPTNIEAFGIVFCEAASLGVPSVTHAIGGTDEIIIHKINGLKYSKDEPICKIVNDIKYYVLNPLKYNELQNYTYQEFLKRLNWQVSIQSLLSKFKEYYEG